MSKNAIAVPLLIMGVGIGWLLNVWGVIAAVDWIWTLLLALVGFLTFFLGGWNKITFIVGSFLLVSSVFSLLRQLDKLTANEEIPYLVILLGLLWLLGEMFHLPAPDWMKDGK